MFGTSPGLDAQRQTDGQLELFGAARAGGHPRLPRVANLNTGATDVAGTETTNTDATGSAAPPAAAIEDDALRRLQASVRWLQDESESYRPLPRAANLLPVSDLPGAGLRQDASPRDRWAHFHPDEPANASALAHPKDPRRTLLERSPRRRTTAALRNLLIASVIAVPPAYFIAKWQWIPGLDLAGSDAGSADRLAARFLPILPTARVPQSVAQIAQPLPPQPENLPALEQKSPEAAVDTTVEARTAAAEPTTVPSADPSAVPAENTVPKDTTRPQLADAPAEPPRATANAPQAETPSQPDPTLNTREVSLWLERGRDFFEAGDVAAARLLFRRAANAGDAAAALAMGTTFDPAVLANRMVRGVGADPEQARVWYEKARALGSPEGPRRIEMLAHR